MKCQYCGSKDNVIDHDFETRFCRVCGNVMGPYGNGLLTKTARFLDFIEE